MQELMDLVNASQYRTVADYVLQLAFTLRLGRPLYVHIDPSLVDALPRIAQLYAEVYEDGYIDGWSCVSMLNTTDLHIDACTFCDRVNDIRVCAYVYERYSRYKRSMRYELKIEPASGGRDYISFMLI